MSHLILKLIKNVKYLIIVILKTLILKIINKNCHLTLKILFYCNILCIILSVHYSVAMFLFIIYTHYKEHDTHTTLYVFLSIK